MEALYSKRTTAPAVKLRYDIPIDVRNRIYYNLLSNLGQKTGELLLSKLQVLLLQEYGRLARPIFESVPSNQHAIVTHLANCTESQVLDLIEAAFRTAIHVGGQEKVEKINKVFREHGIGYELTPYRGPDGSIDSVRLGPLVPTELLPMAIRRDDHVLHDQVVMPALCLLASPAFKVANEEMLKAHAELRSGRMEDSITSCAAAFESVLKTICHHKKWAFDAQRDTCANLVDICRQNDLFPSFYVDSLKAVGIIRNKLGDAHGRGPKKLHVIDDLKAQHLINLTSAHILMLGKLAGMI